MLFVNMMFKHPAWRHSHNQTVATAQPLIALPKSFTHAQYLPPNDGTAFDLTLSYKKNDRSILHNSSLYSRSFI
jgi:hypothetical protein